MSTLINIITLNVRKKINNLSDYDVDMRDYSFFCDIRECGVTTNYVIGELKNKFNLNIKYATQLAKQFQSGNIEKTIINYANPS